MSVVSGKLSFNASFGQQISNLPTQSGQGAPVLSAPVTGDFTPTNGTGADKIDLKYTRTLSLAATPTVLDLKSLTDIEGNAVAFARIRSITIRMRGAADGDTLKLGYATTTANSWVSLVSNPGQIILQAFATAGNGCFFCLAAPGATGYLVGASNKLLQLDPGSATFSIDIEITGVSA